MTAKGILCAPLALLCAGGAVPDARAGEADVVDVDVICRPAPGNRPASICRFQVAVQHADTGWEHYANRYEVVDGEGKVLGTRVLRHPHVEEQPFRRGLARVRVQRTVKQVTVRASDKTHGLGGAEVTVPVPHATSEPAETSAASGKEAASGEGADAP